MPENSHPPLARRITIAALALLAAGCVRPIFPGSNRIFGNDRLDPRSNRTDMREPAASARLARKVVSGKESPSTLIAPDGSRCVVTERRFAEVKEGDSVTCAWQGT